MKLVLAHIAGTLPGLELAHAAKTAPESIQWMPPGVQIITAWTDGEPETRTVDVTQGIAERLNSVLQQLRAKAADGKEDLPFFDFNHDDDAASGNPTEFYWAGSDPKTGGIRAKVQWTAQGEQAILGRAYRRFSPAFLVNDAGEVTGAPINMGGLVNRAAFKSIAPVLSKSGSQTTTQIDMATKIDTNATPTDLTQALAIIAALRIQTAESETAKSIQAKDAEIIQLKEDKKNLQTQLDQVKADAALAHAKTVVAKAAGEGRIAPQDTELHKKWTDRIAKDPTAEELLIAMPVNTALATVVHAGAADAQAAAAAAAGAKPGEHQFLVKAKTMAKERNITLAKATQELAKAEPALYVEYNKSL